MEENIKVRWLTDHEQNKIAPKTLITQVLNENGSRFKDSFDETVINMTESIDEGKRQIRDHENNADIHITLEEKEAWNNIEVPSLDGYATEEYVENLYKKLNSNTVLGFYCVEDVTIVTNGVSKVYPANSNVEITFIEDDTFEIIPTSDYSILSLTAFPGTLGTFYPWLEGIAQFSNILFDMNNVDMYSKWSQGNQGSYHVQKAQYTNCIFWSDNPYVSDVSQRTNYTLTHTSQLPLCYSTIPDNTFKSFYLAFGVNSDPNWGNKAYMDSFAKATWATQVFSYYGARTIGIVGHDDPDFNIVLPKDCRGLMFDARHIENAGTFDAVNVTNFGAKSGSWREAFGFCPSLKRLYIKNLKVSLNISWSPIDYESISYIISAAANTSAITISVSPFTYNLLSQSDFDLAASKNITIALITTNYVEDKRLGEIAGKADKTYVDTKIADLVNSAPEALDTLGELATAFGENQEVVDALNESITNKQNKNVIVYKNTETGKASMTAPEIMEKVRAGENVYYTTSLSGGTLHPYLEGADTGVFFYSNYIDNDRVIGTGILISADGTITNESYSLEHLTDTTIHITSAERNKWNDTYSKTETDNLLTTKANYENPTFEGPMSVNGEAWFAGDVYTGSTGGTNKDEGSKKLATEEYVNNNSFSGDYEDLTNKPFYLEEAWTFISDTFSQSNTALIVKHNEDLYSNCFNELGRYRFTINGTDIYEYEKTSTGTTPQGFIIGDSSMQTIPFALRQVQSTGTETWFQIVGNITNVTSCKAEYYTSSAKHLDDIFLSSNIARTEDQVGLKTSQGGEVFNDITNNVAQAIYAHAEGEDTDAGGQASHAEGRWTITTGTGSHAEGVNSITSGTGAHAEGVSTYAKGTGAHAEGQQARAEANGAHAEGVSTQASGPAQHVEGKYNIESADLAHIIGNGTSGSARSNAHTLDWDGNAWYAGDVYVGSTSGKNKDDGSKKVATEEYVDNKEYDFFILKSSTPGSNKKFKITIDDDGILSSEEVIEE